MLARTHRFHGYNALRSVYQRGRTVRTPLINLRYAARDPRKPYRVAVVVSRKVNKSAVTRNRIRRRIYEAVRTDDAGIRPGTDLVFTVFDDKVAGMEPAELRDTVSGLLRKAAGQA
jgi:ribonuclease P protein component